MVADVRFQVAQPVRYVATLALQPVNWLIAQPLHAAQWMGGYFQQLEQAQIESTQLKQRLTSQAQKSNLVDQLQVENQRLRTLLSLRARPETTGIAAQVLYEAADPFTRKVIIDKGATDGLTLGSPVLDEWGVLGQLTQLNASTSEVTLLIDRDHAIPVLNTRTGARSVAYGDAISFGGSIELRFMATNADVLVGDLLTTSGVDGIYPAGLPVAKIQHIERKADNAFAKIHCVPIANIHGALHLMVLQPLTPLFPATLLATPSALTPYKRGVKK